MELGLMVDYAVRTVLYLAKRDGDVVSRHEISQATEIPLSIVSRIGQMLELSDILSIQKGRGGGYKLKKKPELINLLQVIEAIIGKVTLNRCVESQDVCQFSPKCPVHEVWIEINHRFREMLQSYNFKDLIERAK